MTTIKKGKKSFIPLSEPSQEQKEVFFMLLEELKNEFILDGKVRNLAPRTMRNYEKQLEKSPRSIIEPRGF